MHFFNLSQNENLEPINEALTKLKTKDENAEISLINDIFSCDFIKPKSLSQFYANQLQKIPTFSRSNKNLFIYCLQAGLDMQVCLRPTILGEMCNVFPKRLIMDHYLGGLHMVVKVLIQKRFCIKTLMTMGLHVFQFTTIGSWIT